MIINVKEVMQFYIASQYVDMRKSIDGLMLIVHAEFEMNVLDHSFFLFTNKAINRIKILYYEHNGFWLFIKRMEQGKFKVFEDNSTQTKNISSIHLNWLLEGCDYDQNK